MKKKTDYQVSHRTLYRRTKLTEKALASVRTLYGAACTDNDRLLEANRAAEEECDRLKSDIIKLQSERRILMEQRARFPNRGVDPQAEAVMNMKKAMEHSINTSAALLDAMGELVDHVSGRKARRERDQERDLSIVDDSTGDRE